MNTTNIAIDGMSCGHCVQQVSKALQSVPGVTVDSVVVGSARIEVEDAKTTEAAVRAIEKAGYKAMVNASPPKVSMKSGGGCCGG
ncbi:MAG: cation transporter [Planctomycetota bacterium]|nr:cation transporter [Planctomycetota bacterium]